VGDTTMYGTREVDHLPVTKLSELTTNGRQLMNQARAYEWPSFLPSPEEEEETEREEEPDRRWITTKRWLAKKRRLEKLRKGGAFKGPLSNKD
ncbi:hypothetical protein PMAYCL1PPCAC_11314, partial [Pristionchus mayeri]